MGAIVAPSRGARQRRSAAPLPTLRARTAFFFGHCRRCGSIFRRFQISDGGATEARLGVCVAPRRGDVRVPQQLRDDVDPVAAPPDLGREVVAQVVGAEIGHARLDVWYLFSGRRRLYGPTRGRRNS